MLPCGGYRLFSLSSLPTVSSYICHLIRIAESETNLLLAILDRIVSDKGGAVVRLCIEANIFTRFVRRQHNPLLINQDEFVLARYLGPVHTKFDSRVAILYRP